MNRVGGRAMKRALMGLLSALVVGGAAGSAAAAQPAESKRCCFANWRYAGGCVVQIPQDQACVDVLSVLNNPMSASTGYCGNTNVRGGWVETSCEHPQGVYAGTPSRMGAEELPLELAPTERKLGAGVEQPGPRLRTEQPTYLTPVQPQTLKTQPPSGVVLGPNLPGW